MAHVFDKDGDLSLQLANNLVEGQQNLNHIRDHFAGRHRRTESIVDRASITAGLEACRERFSFIACKASD